MTLVTTLTAIAVAFIISTLLGFVIIPALRRLKFGQSIREEGPKAHQKKAGTPTMGGLIFIGSIIISTLALSYIYDVTDDTNDCLVARSCRFWRHRFS